MAIEEVTCPKLRRGFPDLTLAQEFSIEIPDKEADGILSSMFSQWKVKFA